MAVAVGVVREVLAAAAQAEPQALAALVEQEEIPARLTSPRRREMLHQAVLKVLLVMADLEVAATRVDAAEVLLAKVELVVMPEAAESAELPPP